MPLPIKIGLSTQSSDVKYRDLPRVAAAIQLQVSRDVAGPWQLPPVVVAAFPKPAAVPAGFWHVTVRGHRKGDGDWLGYHSDTRANQPLAWVLAEDGWEMTASHEIVEMLVDPFGNRMMVGPHPKQAGVLAHYLVEACDPPEAFSYNVGGVPVSDFILPTFYADRPQPHVRYSFLGKLPGPRTIAAGGYLSFMVDNQGWFQLEAFRGGDGEVHKLGARRAGVPLRAWLDAEARRLCREVKGA